MSDGGKSALGLALMACSLAGIGYMLHYRLEDHAMLFGLFGIGLVGALIVVPDTLANGVKLLVSVAPWKNGGGE